MRVVELSASTFDPARFILSSHVLVLIDAFKVKRIKVSELPLLLLTNPVDAGVVQLLVVLNLGDCSVIVNKFLVLIFNLTIRIIVLKFFF